MCKKQTIRVPPSNMNKQYEHLTLNKFLNKHKIGKNICLKIITFQICFKSIEFFEVVKASYNFDLKILRMLDYSTVI